jgi:catechol-2,3-dioxygenase
LAEDVRTTAHFYRDVINLPLLPGHHRPAFDLGGVHLVVIEGKPATVPTSGPARFPVLALTVANLDQAVEHLQAHQVMLPWGIEANEAARWVMFYDPAGNLIEFAQFYDGGR